MKSLDEIAISTGTDKNSNCHNYSPYYSIFFDPIRSRTLNLLEVGIYNGDSLRLWREFFPNAMIYGGDIVDCSKHNEERIKTLIMDQSSQQSLLSVRTQLPFMDIIILDGSHQSSDDILSFETLWAHLNSGGYFVIEDTLCGHFSQWVKDRSIIDRVSQMLYETDMGGKVDQNYLCSNKRNERAKYELNQFEQQIEFVFKSCGLVIVKKL